MGVRDALTELHDAGALRVVWVDIADTDAVRDACAAADALWIESPTNPLLDVADLPALCADARGRGLLCVVDSTLATPFGQRPLEHGADVVVHSATKLIGGHSDLLLGAAVAREHAVAERLIHGRESTGATPGALEVFLALRGLRTLPLRLERAQGNAIVLAARLAGHPEVTQVRYPGLPDDPAHAVAAATLDGFGVMLTFRVRGGAERAQALAERVEVFTHVTSFGGVESTLERRARWPAERGVPDDLLRVSVGCEHVDDLWADLERALAATRTPASAAAA
jgi:cystathionine gamma-synthase